MDVFKLYFLKTKAKTKLLLLIWNTIEISRDTWI